MVDLEQFRKFARLHRECEELKKQRDEKRAIMEKMVEPLLAQLADEGVHNLQLDVPGVGPVTLYHQHTKFARPKDKDALNAALMENGLGDIIKHTVNQQTLSALVRESETEDGTPLAPAIMDAITISEKDDLRMKRR